MLKYFKVEYKGAYIGGVAIVRAADKDSAIELVKHDPKTLRFEDVTATEVTGKRSAPKVLYNDNGDY